MKQYLLPVMFAAFVCLAASSVVQAQGSDDRWNGLASISTGTRLVVDQDGKRNVKGRFVSLTGQELSIRAGGKVVGLPRESVAAVYLARRSSRVKRSVIGALAGAGSGLLIGVLAVSVTKGDPLIAAGGIMLGMPAGAVIGAATGGNTKKGELVYSR